MALQTNVTGQPGSMWIRVSLGRREIHAKTQIKGKGASGKVNGLLDWHGLLCSRSVPLGTGRRGHFRETTFPFCLRKQLAFGSPHAHMTDGDSRILDDGRPRKAAPLASLRASSESLCTGAPPKRAAWAGNSCMGQRRMTTGTVKFFHTTRGFGFISPDDGGKDVFVHSSAVEQSNLRYIAEGDRLSFEVQQDARGPKAVNLQPAD